MSANTERLLDMAEAKLKRICDQVKVLNKRLELLQDRYERAEKQGNRPYCESLRLRMTTTEGIRNVYNICIEKQAFRVKVLMYELSAPDPSEVYAPDIDYFSGDDDCIESSDEEPTYGTSDEDDDDDSESDED